MRRLLVLGLTTVLWSVLGTGQVQAIPIIWGEGYTASHLADLPPQAAQELARQFPAIRPDKLGFGYWRFHIFWADLWTSDGVFVVYRDHKSSLISMGNKMSARDLAQLLGVPEEKFSTPFLYHVPLGWLVVAGIVALTVVVSILEKRKPPEQPLAQGPAEVTQLLADPRYQQALREMNPEGLPLEKLSTADIQRGIDALIVQEVPRDQAEANLAQILESMRPSPPSADQPPGDDRPPG